MGLFNFLKKATKPYKDTSVNLIYELLFCDDLDLYKKHNNQPYDYPWSILFSDLYNDTDLYKIIKDNDAGSRTKILAYNKLLNNGGKIDKKELLAVIVEVGLENGLDVLASFKDGTARYINQTGKILIWETTNEISNNLTNNIFSNGSIVINKIGPWDQPRRPNPEKGTVRITFLVSDGLYFGEGPINVLFSDPLAGPTLSSATELMKYLMEQSTSI
jgi:hypothetical protein